MELRGENLQETRIHRLQYSSPLFYPYMSLDSFRTTTDPIVPPASNGFSDSSMRSVEIVHAMVAERHRDMRYLDIVDVAHPQYEKGVNRKLFTLLTKLMLYPAIQIYSVKHHNYWWMRQGCGCVNPYSTSGNIMLHQQRRNLVPEVPVDAMWWISLSRGWQLCYIRLGNASCPYPALLPGIARL